MITLKPHHFTTGRTGHVHCDVHWRLSKQWSDSLDDFDIMLMHDGEGEMNIDGKRYPLHAGIAVLLKPWQDIRAKQNTKKRLRVSFLHFQINRPHQSLQDLATYRSANDLTFAAALMRKIRMLSQQSQVPQEQTQSLLFSLLHELEPIEDNPKARDNIDQNTRQQFTQLLHQLIETPDFKLTINQLADQMHYCPDHFSRLFQRIHNIKPSNFLLQQRIEHAKMLLTETDYNLIKIAGLLSFHDSAHFSKNFKSHTGLTPGQFRNKYGTD